MQSLFAAIMCVVVAAGAQARPGAAPAPPVRETAHLTIATSSNAPAAPGKRLSLVADVTPKPKMHVYAPGQDGYIAITLTLDPDPAFTAAKAKYPAGEKILIEILKETQLVYAKPFRITQDVTPAKGVSGPLTIKGTLRYQACDDKVCYLPVNVPVAWTVKLAAQ